MFRVSRKKAFKLVIMVIPIFLMFLPSLIVGQTPRVIEITATKDNKYRCPGQKGDPVIELKAGEVVKLRFSSFKGPEFEKDGTAHDFTIKEFKDQGWSIRMKGGDKEPVIREVVLVVPDKPGTYMAGCYNVKCGKGHEQMLAKVIIK